MKLILILFYFIFQNVHASSAENPSQNFEWGGGLLTIAGNHYRGSDQGKVWFFPIPYFSYTSKRFEAEPSFIRGIFFENKWFSLKLSFIPGLNVESKGNKAREGMPGLDYTVEVGPMAVFHLFKSEDESMRINFEWPIRETYSTDLSYIKSAGLFTVPYLNIIHKANPKFWNWDFEFSLAPMFADKKYHQRFYGVENQFARTDRPAYESSGGYSGFQTALIMKKRFKKMVILPFIRWDYLKGAVFENSPLIKTNNYVVAGLGLFWFF